MDETLSGDRTPQPRCPSCAAPLGPTVPSACPTCRLPFGDARQRYVDRLDRRIATLTARRRALLTLPDLRPATQTAARAEGPARSPDGPLGAARGWMRAAGPQTLLAAGGVLLLVTAATVFTAVAWRDLPLPVRGGLLVVASAGCARLTRSLARRGLSRTAEATAVLSVALLAVLVNGLWRGGLLAGDGHIVFAAAAGGLAGLSHVLAAWTATTAPRVLAGWLAPAAVISTGVWAADLLDDTRAAELAPLVASAALLGGAVVACAYAEHALAGLGRLRLGTRLAGVVLWLLAVTGVSLTLADLAPRAPDERPAFAAAVVLVVALVVASATARRMDAGAPRWQAAGAAGMWFAATVGGGGALWDRSAAWPELPIVVPLALGVAALPLATSRPAGRGALIGLLPITFAGLVPVAGTLAAVLELAAWRVALPWTFDGPAVALDADPSTLLSATAVVVLVAAVAPRVHSAVTFATALGGGVVAVAVGAAAWDLAGGSVVALVVVAGAAVAVRRATRTTRALPATMVGASALMATLALTAPAVTIATLAAAASVTVAAVATRDGRTRMIVAALAAADVIGLAAASAAATTDGPGPVGVTVAVAGAAGWAVAFATRRRSAVSTGIEGTAAAAFGVALGLAAADGPAWLAIAFALLAVAAAAVAVGRPGRRWMRWLATAAASASSWTVLSDLDVGLVEAYTMPPAIAVSTLAAASLRARPSASSWPVLGTGLSLLTMPTVAQLVADPGDLPRLGAAVAAGALLAAAGRARALQSPLVIGVGVLALAAVTQHGVVTELLPRWALLAAAGTALLWLSVSYERQRVRVATARRRLVAMR